MTTAEDQAQYDDAIMRFEETPRDHVTLDRENEVHEGFTDLAAKLAACTKPGREWSLVLTKLEEAFAWALRAEPKQ